MLRLEPRYQVLVRDILNANVPGTEVWVFGSRIRPDCKPHSDLDLVLRTEQPLADTVLFALQDAFEESDLPVKVDVLDWQQLTPAFRQLILSSYEVFPDACS